jgi:glycosyltransferase involved in cell wall biosynthesis
MKFCTIVCTLNPVDGGIVTWVNRLHQNLKETEHTLEVVTLDSGFEPWNKESSLRALHLGPAKFGRFRYSKALDFYLRRQGREFDAIITHGLWTYPALAVHRAFDRTAGRPLHINMPHGDLDPNFRRCFPVKHYLKKLPFYRAVGASVLDDCDAVLFTCEEEMRLATVAFRSSAENRYVIRYGIDLPQPGNEVREDIRVLLNQLQGKRKLLFFGRIHPKKGPDMLIDAFSKVCEESPDVHLIVAGSSSGELEGLLKQRAQALGISSRISWTGAVIGDSKWYLYRNVDAYILPSHTENFGITVAEAMISGLPVLISNCVNIYREIEATNAGLIQPDTVEGTETLIRGWLAMSPSDCVEMGQRGIRLVQERFLAKQSAEDLITISQSLLTSRDTSRRAA